MDPLPYDAGEVQTWLWLAGVVTLLATTGLLLALVLVGRYRSWILDQLEAFGAWLETVWPEGGRAVRRSLGWASWQKGLLSIAGLVMVGMLVLFVAVTQGWVDRSELYEIDRGVHRVLDGSFGVGLIEAMRVVTRLGDLLTAGIIGGVLAVVFVVRRSWEQLTAAVLTFVVGEGLLWTMKAIFSRDRPGSDLIDTAGASFPSGHAFTGVIVYGFLLVVVWRWNVPAAVRWGATFVLLAVAITIALSRIVLGVHWVTDVLGGFSFGVAWLMTSLLLARVAGGRFGWQR